MQKSVQVREFVDVYVKKNRSKWPMSELHSWIYMKKSHLSTEFHRFNSSNCSIHLRFQKSHYNKTCISQLRCLYRLLANPRMFLYHPLEIVVSISPSVDAIIGILNPTALFLLISFWSEHCHAWLCSNAYIC